MAAVVRSFGQKTGYMTIVGPGQHVEADTCTCAHCNRVWVVRATSGPADPGGWCGMCTAMICAECSAKPCTPFERRLEAIEARARMLEAIVG